MTAVEEFRAFAAVLRDCNQFAAAELADLWLYRGTRQPSAWVSVQEAAKELGFHESTIWRMCREGRLVSRRNAHGRGMSVQLASIRAVE